MHWSEKPLRQNLQAHKGSLNKPALFRSKKLKLSQASTTKKEFLKTQPSELTSLPLLKKHFLDFPQEYSQHKQVLFGDVHFQPRYVEDPLWKLVCLGFTAMMGHFSAAKIWNSRLGLINPQKNSINLYCQTEEVAQLLQQYSFVLLGMLQQYFPALKEVKVLVSD